MKSKMVKVVPRPANACSFHQGALREISSSIILKIGSKSKTLSPFPVTIFRDPAGAFAEKRKAPAGQTGNRIPDCPRTGAFLFRGSGSGRVFKDNHGGLLEFLGDGPVLRREDGTARQDQKHRQDPGENDSFDRIQRDSSSRLPAAAAFGRQPTTLVPWCSLRPSQDTLLHSYM